RQGSTGDLAIASTLATLADMQALLSESRLEGADLVWITEGAVAVGRDDPSLDLVRAPLVGLLRSARSEHPDRRIRLLDLATDSTAMDLWSMLAADHEPELARRRGAIVAPRLAAIAGEERVETRVIVAPERTALICGFGGLGQTLVRHLVKQHGVRH